MNSKRVVCALGSITLAALVPATLLLAALLVVQPVLAQSAAGPDVKPVTIQEINTAAFPIITTTVAVRGAAQEHLEQIRLVEDGNPQDIDVTVEDGGPLAVAILFDLSQQAQEEMGDISALVRNFTAQLPEDTLYALYQATDAEPRGVALPSAYPGPFYPDRGALLNRLADYTPDGPDFTPLLETVQSIQSQFPVNSSGRHIVVFTGPVASSGATDLGAILAGCQNGVQVHSALIAADSATAANAGMLAGITAACNGTNTLYDNPTAAAALRQAMVKPAGLVTLVYRTQQSKPRYLKVEIPDGNNGFHFDGREFPPLKDVRVSIDINSPAVGSVFTSTQPVQLGVEVAVTPYTLRIVKVEYAIDGGRMLPMTESGAGFSAVLPTLDAGMHKLVVRATDELGNQNVDNVERSIEVAEASKPPKENPWIVGAIALAAIVGAAALSVLAWKWWAGRPKSQDFAAAPAFQLVLVEPLPKAPTTIALDNETIILGRDAAYATNVLEDDRISRKQCTIQHSNGKFSVQNNSATNATLLNGQPLKKDGRAVAMKRGAVLTLGPAKYRFDAVGAAIDANLTRDMKTLNGPALTRKMPAAAPNATQQPPNSQPLPIPPLSALPPLMQPAGPQGANGQAVAAIQNHAQ